MQFHARDDDTYTTQNSQNVLESENGILIVQKNANSLFDFWSKQLYSCAQQVERKITSSMNVNLKP